MANVHVIDLFLKSSLLVQLTILLLILFSIISWAIIIHKSYLLNVAHRDTEIFKDKFWSTEELAILYEESDSYYNRISGLEKIFHSGFQEFSRLHLVNSEPKATIDGACRAMRIAMNVELDILETHIPFLGTVGSISPYIGLFGTVLGIMNVFISLGLEKQVTLQMVAPGIAEALIATAIGLFTTIPAVMAYNRLNSCVNKLDQHYNNFMEEFTAIMHRQVFSIVSN